MKLVEIPNNREGRKDWAFSCRGCVFDYGDTCLLDETFEFFGIQDESIRCRCIRHDLIFTLEKE